MTLRAFNRLELFSAMRVALAAPPYRAKLDLLQIDATTGEITLASGVTYEHTSDIYAPDADGVYRKFGEDVPIVSGARCTVAGGYVTNVYATDALGDPLDPPPKLVYQPALSNLESNGLASLWAPSGLVSSNIDAVSSRGIVENMTMIPTTVAEFHQIITSPSVVWDSTKTYVVTFEVKAAGYSWCQIAFTSSIGGLTNFQTFDIGNGVIGTGGSTVGRSAIQEIKDGLYLIALEFTPATSVTAIGPLIYVTDGDRSSRGHPFIGDGTSGIEAGNCQIIEGTLEKVLGSGHIFTSGTPLSTDRTVIQPPLTAHDNDAGLWYLDAEWSMPETATAQGVISVDGAAEGSVLAYTAASGFVASNDGVTTSAIAASNFVMPGSLKHCIVYSQADNKMRLFMDGSLAGTEVAFDGFNLSTVVDLLLSCGYPVKINDLKSYSIASYDDGIALKDELLA